MSATTQTSETSHDATAARAAAARVQPKLPVSRPGDSFEQEADRVATSVAGAGPAPAVASGGSAAVATGVAPSISRLVHRKPLARVMRAEEEEEPQAAIQRAEEEEEPQAAVQRAEEEEEPQAAVQRAEEEEEPQAAVQRAEEEEEPQAAVQRAEEEEEPQAAIQRAEEEEEPQAAIQRAEEEEEPQAAVQRAEEEEEPQAAIQRAEEEEEPQAAIQRAEDEEEPQAKTAVARRRPVVAPASLRTKLRETRGAGKPLDVRTRAAMEAGFGAQFAGVRVHTGPAAVEMSRDLRAQAFTHGRDIFFNAGKFEPDSTRGRMLLAHELTHVVQQGAAEQKIGGGPADTAPGVAGPAGGGERSATSRPAVPRPPISAPLPARPPAPPTRRAPAPAPVSPAAAPRAEPAPTTRGPARGPASRPATTAAGATGRTVATTRLIPRAVPDLAPPRAGSPGVPPAPSAAARPAVPERPAPVAPSPSPVTASVPATSGGPTAAPGGTTAAAREAEAPSHAEAGVPVSRAAAAQPDRERGEEIEKAEPAPGRTKETTAAKAAAPPLGAAPKAKGGKVGEFLRRTTTAAFGAKRAGISRLAKSEKTKQPPEAKLEQAQKSVVTPAREGEAHASASQVTVVAEAAPPKPDEREARQRLTSTLQQSVPASLEAMDRFKEEGKGRVVGEAVKEVVTGDAQDVESTYEQIEHPPAAEAPDEPEALPDVEEAPPAPAVNAGEGVVGSVQPEHTDLTEFDRQSDEAVKQEGITDEQLEMVDEGELAEAKAERKNIKSTVKEAPAAVKQVEEAEKQKVNQELGREEQDARRQMRDERRGQLQGARKDQQKTRSAIEQKREAVTARVNAIYEQANATVRQKLDDLEKKSLADFDAGQAQATRSFEDSVKQRLNAFKARRYGGTWGDAKWIKDKLLGMDDLPEVKQIFETERATFVAAIDALIARITAENRRVVAECREIVAGARRDIEKFVRGLGPELQKTGNDAVKDIRGKLNALDQGINEKEKALEKKLAEKREAAIKAIDQKIEKMKEEMSGALSKLGNLLLNAMLKFFEWALRKAGYATDQLMGIINKGKVVIKKIVSDPIGFLKNLLKAVRDGLDLFQTNIKKHLISGLMAWLTGALSDVPIQLPEKWDLKGILYLVLQILGLTWQNIRVKLVKRLGEKVVSIAEKTVDILKRLITEGPIALWDMIKAKAEEIKEKVMEGIRNWAIVELVKQGLIKLVSFLNPAGAIIQAILAIYNTVMFFVENWERIVEFVKTVFASIADIAMGRLSAAAKFVENALAMTVPIILNFLARLLGLSGIGKTVTGILHKIRAPIDKIVDKVITFVVKMAKKLVAKVKGGAKALKQKGLALIKWWKEKRKFKTKDGEPHTLKFRGSGKSARLVVASREISIVAYLTRLKPSKKRDEALKLAKEIDKPITRGKDPNKGVTTEQAREITNKMNRLCELLAALASGTGDFELPEMVGPKAGKDTQAMWATLASVKKMKTGSKPSGATEEFRQLRGRGLTKGADKWVRMHLISEKLGGKGTPENWVPAPNSVNTGSQVTSFETAAKNLVAKKKDLPQGQPAPSGKRAYNVVWFAVKADLRNAPPKYPGCAGFAKKVRFKAGLHVPVPAQPKGVKWRQEKSPRIDETVTVDAPPVDAVLSVNARHLSKTGMHNLDDIFTDATIVHMRKARDTAGPFQRSGLLTQLRQGDPGNKQWHEKAKEVRDAIIKHVDNGDLTFKKPKDDG